MQKIKFKEKQQAYTWKGIDSRGIRVRGEVAGLTPSTIEQEMHQQGVKLIELKKKSLLFSSFKKQIKKRDIVQATRHLSTLISSGIPLVQALDIIKNGQTKPSFHYLLNTIRKDVTSGSSLHQSLAKHPKYFSELFKSLIQAGEASSTLDITLKQLAEHMEKTESLKQRLKKAMYYPITIVIISLIVTSLLLVFIVPQFDTLFQSFGAELPFFTRAIINSSNAFKTYWIVIILVLAINSVLVIYVSRFCRAKKIVADLLHNIPIVGALIEDATLARVSRTLATTLTAGMPILEALIAAASIANHSFLSIALQKVRDDVATGELMHIAMHKTQAFPSMVVQMISVGVETATVDKMLEKIACFYEEEVAARVSTVITLMEPLIIIILGTIIGTFVIAMYLPIFRLGSIV